MSHKAVDWAMKQRLGRGIAMSVLKQLAYDWNDKRAAEGKIACFPSVDRLSEETGFNRKSIFNALKLLNNYGLVTTGKFWTGKAWANHYVLNFDVLVTAGCSAASNGGRSSTAGTQGSGQYADKDESPVLLEALAPEAVHAAPTTGGECLPETAVPEKGVPDAVPVSPAANDECVPETVLPSPETGTECVPETGYKRGTASGIVLKGEEGGSNEGRDFSAGDSGGQKDRTLREDPEAGSVEAGDDACLAEPSSGASEVPEGSGQGDMASRSRAHDGDREASSAEPDSRSGAEGGIGNSENSLQPGKGDQVSNGPPATAGEGAAAEGNGQPDLFDEESGKLHLADDGGADTGPAEPGKVAKASGSRGRRAASRKSSPKPSKPKFLVAAPEGVTQESWDDWSSKRREYLTEYGWQRTLAQIEKAGCTRQEAVDLCCDRNWRGFKAEWYFNAKARAAGIRGIGEGAPSRAPDSGAQILPTPEQFRSAADLSVPGSSNGPEETDSGADEIFRRYCE